MTATESLSSASLAQTILHSLGSRRVSWGFWATSRVAMLLSAVVGAHWCDPWFYHYAGELAAGHLPYRDLPVEYPPLAMALILLPALLLLPFKAIAPRPDPAFIPPLHSLPAPVPGRYAAYGITFALMMLAIDLITFALVMRMTPRVKVWLPPIVYIGVTFIAGGILQKFDLTAGLMLLLAVDGAVAKKRYLPWIALGAATLIKGFPALAALGLIAALIATAEGVGVRQRIAHVQSQVTRGLATFAGVIGAPAVLVALWAGAQAVAHTVTYHASRGVEIESIAASLAILAAGLLGKPVTTLFHAEDLSRVVVAPTSGFGSGIAWVLGLLVLGGWMAVLVRACVTGICADDDTRVLWLLLAMMAPIMAFMLVFGALPLHYVVVVAPLASLVYLPDVGTRRLWLASLVAISVAGAVVIAEWVWLVRLAPLAVAALVARNSAWATVAFACVLELWRLSQWEQKVKVK